MFNTPTPFLVMTIRIPETTQQQIYIKHVHCMYIIQTLLRNRFTAFNIPGEQHVLFF
jgi:hypothetical protein